MAKKGRPRKTLTKKQEEAAIKALSLGVPIKQVAALVDMAENTFHAYLSSHPAFSAAYKRATELLNEGILKTLAGMAGSGKHPACTIFWAKTRCGFKEKQVIEVNPENIAETAQRILAERMKDMK